MAEFLGMIKSLVRDIAGDDAVTLLNILEENENISEFVLAEDLKLKVNTVRNLLYKLYSHNLVFSSRKKDKQKGWYIYYWTFNFKHARDLLVLRKINRRKELRDQLEKETKTNFYSCKNDCNRLSLEETMDYNFKCPECESRMVQEDSSKKVQEIHKELHKLDGELEDLKKPLIIMAKKALKPKKAKKEVVEPEPKVKKVIKKKATKKVKKKVVKKKVKIKKIKKPAPKKLKKKVKIKKVKKKKHVKKKTKKVVKKKPKPRKVVKKKPKSFLRKLKRKIRRL